MHEKVILPYVLRTTNSHPFAHGTPTVTKQSRLLSQQAEKRQLLRAPYYGTHHKLFRPQRQQATQFATLKATTTNTWDGISSQSMSSSSAFAHLETTRLPIASRRSEKQSSRRTAICQATYLRCTRAYTQIIPPPMGARQAFLLQINFHTIIAKPNISPWTAYQNAAPKTTLIILGYTTCSTQDYTDHYLTDSSQQCLQQTKVDGHKRTKEMTQSSWLPSSSSNTETQKHRLANAHLLPIIASVILIIIIPH
jgi:hypothetical protein